ncbi:MAG: hypothetical protein IIU02_00865 [Treponema sp.]|nr:hypothetical protein [Treponema sp.]MBQ5536456.1 hypothetical protein [Treponema sp.]
MKSQCPMRFSARAFKVIGFAVFCRGFDDVNYSAFESEFGRQGIGC